MVLQDSPPNPAAASNILRQFIISDSMSAQNQFGNQHFDVYDESGMRGTSAYSQSLNVLPSIQSLRERMSRSMDLVQAPSGVGGESEISHTRHLMDLLGAANDSNNNSNQAQRLSLSLGSCVLINPNYMLPGEEPKEQQHHQQQQQRLNDEYAFMGNPFASSSASFNRSYSSSYGGESFSNVVGGSRYLKPAQALLEEMVSIGGRDIHISGERKLTRGGRRGAPTLSAELRAELCDNGILSAEKHQLQVKISKLISLLEEVEGRYEKYYRQMEEVVSSFEVVAGLGAAKTYTGLALQAMSRHFCSLRDAIVSQINMTRRKISQDLPKINSGLTQLSLLDRENRHNNRISLQQLAMIQSQRQAWRPIRGLPDTSVAILRSWLFEHFLHPYPNDSEKLMLSSQTGLTKNQVSNWFINARVRLWKPMIEEMYKEEFGESSEDSNQLFASSSMTREDVADHVED